MKKYQLMAPGPTPVPPNVLLAMARPIIHHRAAEYDALFLEVREGLKRLVQTQQDVVTPACTGTGAMEAAVTNTLCAGDRVIVVNAGAFAQRWLAICKAYGLVVVELEAPHGDTVAPRPDRRGAPGAQGRQGRARSAQRVVHGRAARCARLRPGHARHRIHPGRRRRVESRHRRAADGRLGYRRRRLRVAEGAHAASGSRPPRPQREGVGGGQAVDAPQVLPRSHGGAEVHGEERGALHPRRLHHGRAARGAPHDRRRGPAECPPSPRPPLAGHAGRRGGARAHSLPQDHAQSRAHRGAGAGGSGRRPGGGAVCHVAQHHHRRRSRTDEGQDLPHRPHGLCRRLRHHHALAALEQVLHELGQPVDFGASLGAAQKVFAERG